MLNKLFVFLISLSLASISMAAVQFDGTGDSLTRSSGVSGIPTGAGAECTVSFWVYYTDSSQSANLIQEEPVNTKWIIFLDGGNLNMRGDSTSPTVSVTAPSANRWHHIAAVYRNYISGVHYSEATLYVDGSIAGSCAAASNCILLVASASGKIDVGYLNDVSSYDFDGQMDDIRIYNRALARGRFTGLNTFVLDNDSEIVELANSRSRLTITDGLLAWWKLDDCTDGQGISAALDSSGRGNNLTGGTGNPICKASSWINYP